MDGEKTSDILKGTRNDNQPTITDQTTTTSKSSKVTQKCMPLKSDSYIDTEVTISCESLARREVLYLMLYDLFDKDTINCKLRQSLEEQDRLTLDSFLEHVILTKPLEVIKNSNDSSMKL